MLAGVCRDVEKLSHGGVSAEDFDSIVVGHLDTIKEKVSSLRQDLPESDDKKGIVEEYETVAMCQLPRRLELVRAFIVKSVFQEAIGSRGLFRPVISVGLLSSSPPECKARLSHVG